MRYMGSKASHAKDILPIILAGRAPGQWYVEPFVGGFNLIDKVVGPRIASDTNYYLIELYKAVQSGWCPPESVSEDEYQAIRQRKEAYPPWLVGFVGFGCCYGGKWFGGFARGGFNSNGQPRNHAGESRRNILRQAKRLAEVLIFNQDYRELAVPAGSIIYCDPPYAGTTGYRDDFDHDEFFAWARMKADEGHRVFVSEYSAPDDFKCVWAKAVNNSLTRNTGGKQGVERLFAVGGQ